MTEAEAQECINEVLKEYPDLTANGFSYKPRYGYPEDHVYGSISPQGFITVVEWLLNYDAFDRRKTINTGTGSYG